MEMAESRKRKEHIVKQSRRCAVSVALVSNVLAVYVSVEYVSVWVCKQDFHKLRTPYAGLTGPGTCIGALAPKAAAPSAGEQRGTRYTELYGILWALGRRRVSDLT